MANILIVEDTELQMRLLQSFLQLEHDVVDTATDGDEAVELAERHDVNVVVMDLNLPNTSGIQATERITSAEEDVKIVVSTAVIDEGAIEAATAAGADEVLIKPFDRTELLAAVRSVVE